MSKRGSRSQGTTVVASPSTTATATGTLPPPPSGGWGYTPGNFLSAGNVGNLATAPNQPTLTSDTPPPGPNANAPNVSTQPTPTQIEAAGFTQSTVNPGAFGYFDPNSGNSVGLNGANGQYQVHTFLNGQYNSTNHPTLAQAFEEAEKQKNALQQGAALQAAPPGPRVGQPNVSAQPTQADIQAAGFAATQSGAGYQATLPNGASVYFSDSPSSSGQGFRVTISQNGATTEGFVPSLSAAFGTAQNALGTLKQQAASNAPPPGPRLGANVAAQPTEHDFKNAGFNKTAIGYYAHLTPNGLRVAIDPNKTPQGYILRSSLPGVPNGGVSTHPTLAAALQAAQGQIQAYNQQQAQQALQQALSTPAPGPKGLARSTTAPTPANGSTPQQLPAGVVGTTPVSSLTPSQIASMAGNYGFGVNTIRSLQTAVSSGQLGQMDASNLNTVMTNVQAYGQQTGTPYNTAVSAVLGNGGNAPAAPPATSTQTPAPGTTGTGTNAPTAALPRRLSGFSIRNYLMSGQQTAIRSLMKQYGFAPAQATAVINAIKSGQIPPQPYNNLNQTLANIAQSAQGAGSTTKAQKAHMASAIQSVISSGVLTPHAGVNASVSTGTRTYNPAAVHAAVSSAITAGAITTPLPTPQPTGKRKYNTPPPSAQQQGQRPVAHSNVPAAANMQRQHGTVAPKYNVNARTNAAQIDQEARQYYTSGSQSIKGNPNQHGGGANGAYQAALAKVQGFDGKPTVVSKSEFDKIIASGAQEMFRGVAAYGGKSSLELADQFRHGDYYVGTGIYGNGTFAAYAGDPKTGHQTRSTALQEALSPQYAGNGTVMRFTLKPDAKLIEYKQASREMTQEAQDFQRANPGVPLPRIYSNEGAWATAKGYDAISRPEGNHQNSFVNILNRTAVIIANTNEVDGAH